MPEKSSKEVTRYTLQSFVGKTLNDIVLGAQQKEAVKRLVGLQDRDFDALCADVSNEIHRRCGMKYDKANPMQEKLARLPDAKFKCLVAETLTVFYMKNPQYEIEEMPTFLVGLRQLIESIKHNTAKDAFVKRLSTQGFYTKIYMLLDYLSEKSIDGGILECLKRAVDSKASDEAASFLEVLSFPGIFISKIPSKWLDSNEELAGHCKGLKACLEDRNVDILERAAASKAQLAKILQQLVDAMDIPASKIKCFESEIDGMTRVLECICEEAEGKKKIELDKIQGDFATLLDRVMEKRMAEDGKEAAREIQRLREEIEAPGEKLDVYKRILGASQKIRSILGQFEVI